ncbi:hypothetical protein EV383_5253 [Pseudonocardia sediminis]|uniref:Fe/B12 periplasmic-binding domain-containing protein n=1 Tax=Pseudonocardia sediminis TaxID=1397368 RepID=A0A4Q7V4B7_PSEST|nr:ABC transporter substrate-binding protein [Pseudonocardia sediminis]RZT88314.1 hypothetical protein EV383_5253 [Pseudonocardia sediminis]
MNPPDPRARVTAASVMGGGRPFVDATGTSVPLGGPVRTVLATDESVGALLVELGANLVGCAGSLDGVASVGEARSPDPAAVAKLRPSVIVTGAVGRTHDLADPAVVTALRKVAPVVAVDLDSPASAAADLRALLGPVQPPGSRSLGRHEDPSSA